MNGVAKKNAGPAVACIGQFMGRELPGGRQIEYGGEPGTHATSHERTAGLLAQLVNQLKRLAAFQNARFSE